MSKPWDHLRVAPPQQTLPLDCGQWMGQPELPTVEIVGFRSHGVELRIGSYGGGIYTAIGLRQFAEFAIELADQLEKQ
jgi:hypothetical protein